MSNPSGTMGIKAIADTTPIAGATSIVLNGGIVKQVAVSNDSRRSILLSNKGVSYPVYLGVASTMVSGSSGSNFAMLRTNERVELNNYSGVLYAVHSGASGTYEHLGVFDIG